jgi:hypothetical protein
MSRLPAIIGMAFDVLAPSVILLWLQRKANSLAYFGKCSRLTPAWRGEKKLSPLLRELTVKRS